MNYLHVENRKNCDHKLTFNFLIILRKAKFHSGEVDIHTESAITKTNQSQKRTNK